MELNTKQTKLIETIKRIKRSEGNVDLKEVAKELDMNKLQVENSINDIEEICNQAIKNAEEAKEIKRTLSF